ncbi:MAG: hypothetical protein QXU21_08320, partial [Candidatus Bathyarchaeia archaeon]
GKLAVLGTRFLTESEVYPSKLRDYGIKWAVPEVNQREVVQRFRVSNRKQRRLSTNNTRISNNTVTPHI